ncbi:MAG: glutamate--tRNA ligase [Phycisphaeraceae bacterium]|nr:glutamate--tRNA ligase [Phycisphaeraceae bacterium]
MTTPSIVTRFAPSPTGLLHVGGARTALFSWAYAKGRGGTFILRLEDTDQKRSSEAAAEKIIEDLRWLGLNWDNSGGVIPRQSQRLARYNEVIDELKSRRLAYDDAGAVRFRMDNLPGVAFDDAVYGHIEVGKGQLEDFVIKKADGFPTFHLAVVVDDIDMNVTHVIRGQEHLSNTAKHAALYDALGKPRPVWVHTPSIMNPDGSKMSKRDKAKVARKAALARIEIEGREAFIDRVLNVKPVPMYIQDSDAVSGNISDKIDGFIDSENDDILTAAVIALREGIRLPEINVADFRASGYLPGVLCNYLALLGWNPGNDVERFDLDFMCETFDFDRINKANSKFDREKLLAFNADTLQKMPPEEFASLLKEHQPRLATKLGDQFRGFAGMYQPRSRTLNDPAELGRFFFEAPTTYDDKAVKKNLARNDGEGLKLLGEFRDVLAGTEWNAAALQAAVEKFTADKQLKNMGSIAQPLRVALTGTAVSPPIDQTLELIGQQETLARVDRCLDKCKEN